jgi:hypothetical protein
VPLGCGRGQLIELSVELIEHDVFELVAVHGRGVVGGSLGEG